MGYNNSFRVRLNTLKARAKPNLFGLESNLKKYAIPSTCFHLQFTARKLFFNNTFLYCSVQIRQQIFCVTHTHFGC